MSGMTEAEEAHACAKTIMERGGKEMAQFVGEWKALMLYLEKRVREEKAVQGKRQARKKK